MFNTIFSKNQSSSHEASPHNSCQNIPECKSEQEKNSCHGPVSSQKLRPLTNTQKAATHQLLKTALTTNKDQNQSDLTTAITAATTQTQQRMNATKNQSEKDRLNQRIQNLSTIKSFISTDPKKIFIGLIGWGNGCLGSNLASRSNISAVDGFLYKDTNGKLTYQRLDSCLEFFLALSNTQKVSTIPLKETCSSRWDFGLGANKNAPLLDQCKKNCCPGENSTQPDHLPANKLEQFDTSTENTDLDKLKPKIIPLLQFDHAYHELLADLKKNKETYDDYVEILQNSYKELIERQNQTLSQNPPPNKDWVKNTIQSLHTLGCGLAHYLGKSSENSEEDTTKYNQRANISDAKSMIITDSNTPEQILSYLNRLITTRKNLADLTSEESNLLDTIKSEICELTTRNPSS